MVIKHIIKKINPGVIMIVEPRRVFEINHYNSISSKPAVGTNRKVNCQIFLDKKINWKEYSKDIDYVSIVASGRKPF